MLPQRIRGPRSKAERQRNGYDPIEDDVPRMEPKVVRRSPAHRDFVRDHNCCVPGCVRRPIEVAHVRVGGQAGMGQKPSDRWTIALCGGLDGHHAEQHRLGEPSFEKKYRIDMKALAAAFTKASPKRRLLETMP